MSIDEDSYLLPHMDVVPVHTVVTYLNIFLVADVVILIERHNS